ncbi:isochorismatase family cysteine hydrolase [Bacillus amyloliquefaciens]|uniref:cysteine hydrolase family protein n=1 Tax=Bacillus amyloliquefaciens TaxID=1390 RepID=UPI00255B8CCD|nr:isochorismatase family cysteine hydrolase [Bacillus amyloliquefaciens]WIX31185.1 isochorismatase family cysteine hydrolase [Bacillus amyloliquefaciens]
MALRDAADRAGVPVIYVNDNDGQWHSQRDRLVETALSRNTPGRTLTEALRPRDSDYFVIKPQFTGFYATNLPVLLPQLAASRLVLTGVAADICVLFTAAGAVASGGAGHNPSGQPLPSRRRIRDERTPRSPSSERLATVHRRARLYRKRGPAALRCTGRGRRGCPPASQSCSPRRRSYRRPPPLHRPPFSHHRPSPRTVI